jgi:hypothetical protein
MSLQRRFQHEQKPTFFIKSFDVALIILFCVVGLLIYLSLIPSDSWTPAQLLTSP